MSSVQLNATALASPPVSVALDKYYNIIGITSVGFMFSNNGFDDSFTAYPSTVLTSPVEWQGVPFQIGPPDLPDAVYNATIALSGKFARLIMLADAVNNQTPALQQFIINYTDGTSTVLQQEMSDWEHVAAYPGEASVLCSATRNTAYGTVDSGSVCLHGYSLPLDSTKTLSSITLPDLRNIVVVSIELLPPAVSGACVYDPAAGTVLPSGSQTLTCTFLPNDQNSFATSTASVPLTVTRPPTALQATISWPAPQPIPQGTALNSVQLDANARYPVGPVFVPLQDASTINALYSDDAPVESNGFDGNGDSYSATALGSTLNYSGFAFPLGPTGVPSAVTSTNIVLPQGSFSTIYLLGSATSTAQIDQPFTVRYADGSTTTQAISLSSWMVPSNFPGETTVATTDYQDSIYGRRAQAADVYGYQMTLDPTKTVQSLTLPTNSQVVLLAAGLESGAEMNVAGNFVYTPAAGSVLSVGAQTLSATFYPADVADYASVTAQNSITVTPAGFTFTTSSSTTIALMASQPTQVLLNIAPLASLYPGAVVFSTTGPLPPGWTAVFSPARLQANAGPQNVILTLSAARGSLGDTPGHNGRGLDARLPLSLAFVLLFPFASLRRLRCSEGRKSGLRSGFLGVLLLLVPLCCLVGCGSGYNAVTYYLVVHAVSGNVDHTIPLTLQKAASPQ